LRIGQPPAISNATFFLSLPDGARRSLAPPMPDMRKTLDRLYNGSSQQARMFRLGMLVFDVIIIIFFITASFLPQSNLIHALELAIGLALLADFLARWWICKDPAEYFRQFSTWTDLLVLVTLVLPFFTENLLFLRLLRAVRLFRSYHLIRDLRSEFAFFRKNSEAVEAAINLLVFIFITSAVVYVVEAHRHPKVGNFVDALYFTVSTLTTTGFGDIVFTDMWGRILSIFIMLAGVGLFLRLVQTLFRPTKVNHECPACGLTRHELDAVHCKHCGLLLHIKDSGIDA
jgi:voltage-gated potassium channel